MLVGVLMSKFKTERQVHNSEHITQEAGGEQSLRLLRFCLEKGDES